MLTIDGAACKITKIYQYKVIVLEDRGHITDPRLVHALNVEGAEGWKHKEEQSIGSSRLAVMLERELTLIDALPDDGITVSAPDSVQEIQNG
jgi:hypothetical protein